MDDFCTQSNLNSMAFKRPQDQPRRPFIDTFSFIPCRRVDSDASSFYFRPLLPVDMVAESPVSLPKLPDKQVQSQFWVPPLKRLQFCCHIIREAWCHQKDASLDSVMSDFSAMYLGRPGIGDKMFDHAVDLVARSRPTRFLATIWHILSHFSCATLPRILADYSLH
jgi:hypothetical protein